MLDILKFIFSSFWIWLGFTIITSIVLYYVVNGIVQTVAAICIGKAKRLSWAESGKEDQP